MGLLEFVIMANAGGIGLLGGLFVGIIVGMMLLKSFTRDKDK